MKPYGNRKKSIWHNYSSWRVKWHGKTCCICYPKISRDISKKRARREAKKECKE